MILRYFLLPNLKDFSKNLIDLMLDPFFSIDINNDGKSDLKQLIKPLVLFLIFTPFFFV